MITEFEVDGIRYNVNELPPQIIQMVARYDVWSTDAEKARFDLDKAELARSAMSNEIITAVRTYNAELVKQMQKTEAENQQTQPPAKE